MHQKKKTYNNYEIKAYALLLERCAKIIQNKISAQFNFEI